MILGSLARGRVFVVGDVMLDRYMHGQARRLSPEAPVPVLHGTENRKVPGGAANVAANIAALGGQAILVGVVGADEGRAELIQALAGFGPGTTPHFVVDKARPTTLKTRFVCGGQQLLRLDQEVTAPIDAAVSSEVEALISQHAPAASAVILSDYGKGLLTDGVIRHAINVCSAAGRTLIVDPRRLDFAVYRGASVLTPNRRELTDATGLACESDEEAERAAQIACEATGAAILLTRSEKGLSLFVSGEEPIHLPTNAREVFDVSGAGDTVVATLALSLANGLSLRQSMRIANVSAGIVVRKHGTATLTLAELDRALRVGNDDRKGQGRILDLEAALRMRREWREQGLVVGFANGCFDILHPGHVHLLEEAAANCDRLIVALNGDDSVRRLKGSDRPMQGEFARARIIGALSAVDMVVVFDEDTPYEIIAALKPDLLVKGADYREDQVVGADLVKAAGGRVLLVDLAEGHSTTALVRRSRRSELQTALMA